MEHDSYMVWIDAWSCLSGFGKYIVIDEKVRDPAHTACSFARDAPATLCAEPWPRRLDAASTLSLDAASMLASTLASMASTPHS